MVKSVYRNMDPFEIQNRFSEENYLFFKMDESNFRFEDYMPFINRLPQREIDLIEMYYRGRKKQKEIAEFFGVTQGAVSHRLSRARKRLAFLRDMPKLRSNIGELLSKHFDKFDIDVITCMIETTCQSKTADILNKGYKLRGKKKMTQVKVRHKFDRAFQKLKKLRKLDVELDTCYKLVDYIQKNLYMMHEVILPHFYRGYKVKYRKVC